MAVFDNTSEMPRVIERVPLLVSVPHFVWLGDGVAWPHRKPRGWQKKPRRWRNRDIIEIYSTHIRRSKSRDFDWLVCSDWHHCISKQLPTIWTLLKKLFCCPIHAEWPPVWSFPHPYLCFPHFSVRVLKGYCWIILLCCAHSCTTWLYWKTRFEGERGLRFSWKGQTFCWSGEEGVL